MSNNGGGPFNEGNNKPPRGGNNSFPGGGDSRHLVDQIPRSYIVRPTRLWIRPTCNLGYPSWYPI